MIIMRIKLQMYNAAAATAAATIARRYYDFNLIVMLFVYGLWISLFVCGNRPLFRLDPPLQWINV